MGNLDIQGKLGKIKRHVKVWHKEVNTDLNEQITQLEKLQFQKDENGSSDLLKVSTSEKLSKVYQDRAKM